MATKQQTLEAAARGEGCLGRAADDEPVFVLRAHDRIAPAIVRQWAEKARGLGAHVDKTASAMGSRRRDGAVAGGSPVQDAGLRRLRWRSRSSRCSST